VEIACDESGYEGERLIHTTSDTFAHASVHLDVDTAAACVLELRARIRSPAVEYKAGHLLREKHRATLWWFLGPDGPLPGHASVYLIDKPYFVVDRLVTRLLAADPAPFYRAGRAWPDAAAWDSFLVAANNLQRTRADAPEPAFFAALSPLAEAPGPLGSTARDLAGSRPAVAEMRGRITEEPLPPMDTLAPAVVAAVDRWSVGGVPVAIVHDRQTTLPLDRIARLRELTGGRLADLRLIDSAIDPRIQIADFLAGIATRHLAAGPGHPRRDPDLEPLLTPYIDRSSIWPPPEPEGAA
jgi:hypothetical protein